MLGILPAADEQEAQVTAHHHDHDHTHTHTHRELPRPLHARPALMLDSDAWALEKTPSLARHAAVIDTVTVLALLADMVPPMGSHHACILPCASVQCTS